MKKIIYCLAILPLALLSCGTKTKKEVIVQNSDAQGATSQGGIRTYPTQDHLPACDTLSEGLMFWVEAEDAFAICREGTYIFLDLRGDSGPAGSNGEDGANGNDGETPISNDLFTSIHDAQGDAVGYRLDDNGILNMAAGEIVVYFQNQAIGKFDLNTGAMVNSLSIDRDTGALDSGTYCAFTSSDCSGVCYLNGDTHVPLKNAIFRTPSAFLLASGSETSGAGRTINSVYTGGACNMVGAVVIASSYTIAGTYAFPSAVSHPIATPMEFSAAP